MMLTLTSKSSSQISFPSSTPSVSALHPALSITVESGVAVATLLGTNPQDWTRDTLSFPVGVPCPAANFHGGIASASPASFWTPLNAASFTTENIGVQVGGFDGSGASFSASGSGQAQVPILPPIGCAVDSATIAYSAHAGQPVLTLDVAVFGNCTAMLRVSYTAHIVIATGGVIVLETGTATISN